MKVIKSANSLEIPEGIELSVKNREVSVKGPRGSLTKTFAHAPIDLKKDGNKVCRAWGCVGLSRCTHTHTHRSWPRSGSAAPVTCP